MLVNFWSNLLHVDKGTIRIVRKSNSGRLSGRNWCSKYGVINVCANDTYLRSKLEAWMVTIKSQW